MFVLTAAAAAAAGPFTDVAAGSWDAAAVAALDARHVLTGFPDGTFRPEDPVTRAQVVAMIYRFLHDGANAAPPATPPYPDVPTGAWFAGDAAAAQAGGWLPFVPSGQPLLPHQPATREEAVTAVMLAAGLPAGSGDLSHFRDATQVDAWAFHPMVTAVDLGYLHGYPDFTLRPRQAITRGEFAVLLAAFGHNLIAADGRLFRITGEMTMVATAYSDSESGIGTTTATGTHVHVGEAAVDPSVIPMGTYMWVSGYNTPYLPAGGILEHAEDTGGAIVGHRIDLYVNASAYGTDVFGEQTVQVDLLTPLH